MRVFCKKKAALRKEQPLFVINFNQKQGLLHKLFFGHLSALNTEAIGPGGFSIRRMLFGSRADNQP